MKVKRREGVCLACIQNNATAKEKGKREKERREKGTPQRLTPSAQRGGRTSHQKGCAAEKAGPGTCTERGA